MWYGIHLPPYLNILISLYVFIGAYAIIRYRIMDIEVIIRETAVYAGIFGFSVGIFALAMMIGQQALQPYFGHRQWVVPAISLLVVTFAVRPIERLIYNTIGKALFKKRYEYQKTLQDAAAGMATIRDPKKLLQLIAHVVSMKMKLEHVSVFIYDNKSKKYELRALRGKNGISDLYSSIKDDDILIEWLKEKRYPLALDDLRRWIKEQRDSKSKDVLASDLIHIEDRLENLNTSVCVPSFYKDELLGILMLGNKKSKDFFTRDDLHLFSALADEAAIAIKNSQLYFEIEERAKEIEALYEREHHLFMHASIAFAAAIDARDPYTHGHSERVTNYSIAIFDYIGPTIETEKNPVFKQRLQIAAVLHDIGKIGISDKVLHKPGQLDPQEKKEMEKHPVIGAEIVSHIKGLFDIVGGIKYHHERYDGKGYPEGLRSEDIPFMARIIAVADTYDAMTSDRPYRKGMSATVAKDEIKKQGSVQFDPFMVAAFLKAFEEGKIKKAKECFITR
jgi:HD-GYP domain-containing protein (c-di-GMP phosphodiesterase class II)